MRSWALVPLCRVLPVISAQCASCYYNIILQMKKLNLSKFRLLFQGHIGKGKGLNKMYLTSNFHIYIITLHLFSISESQVWRK